MKAIFAGVFLSLFLSACISAPNIDFANIDSACSQQCASNHAACMSGFKLFPLVAESQCNDAMETCAKTCPPKSGRAVIQTNQPSVTDRLTELDSLHKSGLFNEKDYEAKKQEILKAM